MVTSAPLHKGISEGRQQEIKVLSDVPVSGFRLWDMELAIVRLDEEGARDKSWWLSQPCAHKR